jgi:LmbE family N-acetylglucosaminyl deacetylase
MPMFKLKLFETKKNPKILLLGAHSDDIEIGCGGTILRLIKEVPNAQFRWIVFSAKEQRSQEALQSAKSFLNIVGLKRINIQEFKESYFPFTAAKIKDYFEKLKNEYSPDLVFTHYSNDAHQDHELISKLTWNTFRNNLILEYEIPKYDGDLVTPNFYVYLHESFVQKKIDLIWNNFQTQKEKKWFSKDTFKSIMRIRGLESNSPSSYAEAFHCKKICY